jgi:hypothetical protein
MRKDETFLPKVPAALLKLSLVSLSAPYKLAMHFSVFIFLGFYLSFELFQYFFRPKAIRGQKCLRNAGIEKVQLRQKLFCFLLLFYSVI